MSQVLTAVQLASTRALYTLLSEVLTELESQIPAIGRAKMDVITGFIEQINSDFHNLERGESLHRSVNTASLDIDSLTLVDDDQLEAQLAVEGMVAYSRNEHLPLYIAFNTRLNSLFEGNPINEASNPLDPEQIANAFTAAIKELKLVGSQNLTVYREFNKGLLRKLDQVLNEANRVLIENDVIPDLSILGINKPAYRSRTTRPRDSDDTLQFGQQERAARAGDREAGGSQAQLFSMLRGLLHQFEPGSDGTGAPGKGRRAIPGSDGLVTRGPGGEVPRLQTSADGETMDQQQLFAALTRIQQAIAQRGTDESGGADKVVVDEQRIHRPLAETLQEAQQEGKLSVVDQNSSDVINLVSLLYNVIREDQSVPRRINDLIDRTQISIAKIALSDTSFFDREDHPARELLNEFASASVGWTEEENFRQDPLYKKIEKSVDRILTEQDAGEGLFDELLADFREFREEESAKSRQKRPGAAPEASGDTRALEAQALVDQTIDERVLGREMVPFTQELLQGPWHRFMVLLALKEGTGSKAWKHAITTLDVLLWTLQPHQDADDRKRLDAINQRLLNNLRKALKIASLEYPVIDALLARIRELQEASFPPAGAETPRQVPAVPAVPGKPEPVARETTAPEVASAIAAAVEHPASTVTEFATSASAADGASEVETAPSSHGEPKAPERAQTPPPAEGEQAEQRFLKQVDDLAVGTWVEFPSGQMDTARCKLAAKITAIDKLIFVNRQGIKVVETTRDRLAMQLQLSTVRIISDGQLFSRALETVIGELREAQHIQQTGGAYRGTPG